MASPFVAARVNDVAVEVQIEEGGEFVPLITICDLDPVALAHATDSDFVPELAGLLAMAGVRAEDQFADGEEIEVDLENPETHEIETTTIKCTKAKMEYARAHPGARSGRPPVDDADGMTAEEREHMADMDDAANHAQMERMQQAQRERFLIAQTAEALNSVIKLAKANGLERRHLELCFEKAGGVLPTDADRAAMSDDEDEDADMMNMSPGGPQAAQCQQQ